MVPDEDRAILHIDASDRDADLLWRTGFWAGDPFVFAEIGGRSHLLLTDLELGRGRKEARVDEVHSWSAIERAIEAESPPAAAGEARKPVPYEVVIERFLRERGVGRLRVPSRFPLRLADRLRERGFDLEPGAEPFYAERARKRPEEIAAIEAIQRVTEEAMLFAIDRIRASEVRDGELWLDGAPLDVARLKRSIRVFCLEKGAQLGEVIVAPGDQGCDPHDAGSGPLRAGETIIIDIFPRDLATKYWGDMTRTVVKGRASDDLRRLHAAVREAQAAAIAAIAPGATGDEVHRSVQRVFERAGFPTELRAGNWVGFFHGTGHGVGLDIHEPPRLSKNGPTLAEGMVITVEPGLYYPGLGGCRLEDLVVVTASGCRNLNRAPYDLEV